MKYIFLLALLLATTVTMADSDNDKSKRMITSNVQADEPCSAPLQINIKELKKSEVPDIDHLQPGTIPPTPGKLKSFLPE